MDGDDKGKRLRSFVIGGLLGASAAVATARRRRAALHRREERAQTPAGLAAFEGAPCFEEALEDANPPAPPRTSDA